MSWPPYEPIRDGHVPETPSNRRPSPGVLLISAEEYS
jgi:hypothetical protein